MKCKLLPIPQSVRWSEAIHLAGGLVRRDGQPLVSLKLGVDKRSEWYRLTVTESGIAIEAGSTAGAQQAVDTLRQNARQGRDSATLPGGLGGSIHYLAHLKSK